MGRRNSESNVRKIAINGNVQTVFWLYLILVSGSLAALGIVELNILKKVVAIFRLVHMLFKVKWKFVMDYLLT